MAQTNPSHFNSIDTRGAALWFGLLKQYRLDTLERHGDRIATAIYARLSKTERA